MVKKLVNTIQRHDHWFAEWWSSVFLLAVGIYGLYQQNSFIIQQSFIDGFLQFMPAKIQELLFISAGLLQFFMLRCDYLIGRGLASFYASSLFIWGFLNILIYGQWHFSLVAWGVFASINLYACPELLEGQRNTMNRFEILRWWWESNVDYIRLHDPWVIPVVAVCIPLSFAICAICAVIRTWRGK